MSFDFSRIAELSTARGKLVELKNSAGRVIWAVKSADGGKVILEVEKITSDTYAGETTYTGEQFILLDIYPKTNGTVTVTYGGLTKTITDTSGAEKPNAQQVFFGTFNGVTDEVETPANGELTIVGDFYAFGCGIYSKSNKNTSIGSCLCVTAITGFGETSVIPDKAFGTTVTLGCSKISGHIDIPDQIQKIGTLAFGGCSNLESVTIGKGIESIGVSAFNSNIQNMLRRIDILATTPPYLCPLESVTPESPDTERYMQFGRVNGDYFALEKIIVPNGCGSTYKAATGWAVYADYITEAS